jgi:hypothetical protein
MSVAVVEIGTRYTKCGFAGEGTPRHIIPKSMRQVENLHQPGGKTVNLSFDMSNQSHQSVSGAYSGGLGCAPPKHAHDFLDPWRPALRMTMVIVMTDPRTTGVGFIPKEPPSSPAEPVRCCKTLTEWKPIIRRHLDEVFFGYPVPLLRNAWGSHPILLTFVTHTHAVCYCATRRTST